MRNLQVLIVAKLLPSELAILYIALLTSVLISPALALIPMACNPNQMAPNSSPNQMAPNSSPNQMAPNSNPNQMAPNSSPNQMAPNSSPNQMAPPLQIINISLGASSPKNAKFCMIHNAFQSERNPGGMEKQ